MVALSKDKMIRQSRYAQTSLWNGSNMGKDDGMVCFEQTEGEEFLRGSDFSQKDYMQFMRDEEEKVEVTPLKAHEQNMVDQ